MTTRSRQTEFTGRHMLLVMLAFFGTIITVNFTMAWFAKSSWTGFVVENSYVASQDFNRRMAATRSQNALGWSGELTLNEGVLRYSITDSRGQTVALAAVTVTFKRPVDDREDHTIVLSETHQGYESSHPLADGVWIAEIVAEAGLPELFRDTRRIAVRDGSVR